MYMITTFYFISLLSIADWISIDIKLNNIYIHSKNHKMPAVVCNVLAKIYLSLKKKWRYKMSCLIKSTRDISILQSKLH